MRTPDQMVGFSKISLCWLEVEAQGFGYKASHIEGLLGVEWFDDSYTQSVSAAVSFLCAYFGKTRVPLIFH